MLKQIVAIILLSVALIMTMSYAQDGVQLLLSLHDWLAEELMNVFSEGKAGNTLRELIALLAPPILIGLIPALIYWMAKRSWFPYFMECVWIIWIVQVSALVIASQATSIVN